MIIWKYEGLPTEVDLYMSRPDTTYSVKVLVMVKWAYRDAEPGYSMNALDVEPRLAQYVTYKPKEGIEHSHWIIWGMTGATRVIAWTYISPLKPHKILKP